MCLAQGHNTVRLKPAAPRSGVKHSTTEPLCSLVDQTAPLNHVIVANFYVANMSFNAIPESKILAKISEFTVHEHACPV